MAESCTGGLVGHRLTNIPGSSRYVERGVVVYSNEAKSELLGVPEELLARARRRQRAGGGGDGRGVCRISAASACGMAMTGIAGPDGGSPEKPVGTVFIAAAAPAPRRASRCAGSASRAGARR